MTKQQDEYPATAFPMTVTLFPDSDKEMRDVIVYNIDELPSDRSMFSVQSTNVKA